MLLLAAAFCHPTPYTELISTRAKIVPLRRFHSRRFFFEIVLLRRAWHYHPKSHDRRSNANHEPHRIPLFKSSRHYRIRLNPTSRTTPLTVPRLRPESPRPRPREPSV